MVAALHISDQGSRWRSFTSSARLAIDICLCVCVWVRLCMYMCVYVYVYLGRVRKKREESAHVPKVDVGTWEMKSVEEGGEGREYVCVGV